MARVFLWPTPELAEDGEIAVLEACGGKACWHSSTPPPWQHNSRGRDVEQRAATFGALEPGYDHTYY